MDGFRNFVSELVLNCISVKYFIKITSTIILKLIFYLCVFLEMI